MPPGKPLYLLTDLQFEQDYHALRSANKVCFFDTDATYTDYFSELYMGHRNELVQKYIDADRYDLLIYLKASVPTLVKQIHKRGRDYEMNIDVAYLERLNKKYNQWIEELYEGRVLVVEKDTEDFVADPSVFERICAEVDRLDVQKKLF